MPKQITPFLTFQGGVAEQAMRFYLSMFDDGRTLDITRYGAEGPGPEGTVQLARFSLAGQEFRCSDSFVRHASSFTPSFSVWIETSTEAELDRLLAALSEDGAELMPLTGASLGQRSHS